MVFVAGATFAQKNISISGKILQAGYSYKPIPKPVLEVSSLSNNTIPHSFLPPGFYYNNLAFFCKQEIKLEKITRIPLKFRLGSVENCDRLEGKFKYD